MGITYTVYILIQYTGLNTPLYNCLWVVPFTLVLAVAINAILIFCNKCFGQKFYIVYNMLLTLNLCSCSGQGTQGVWEYRKLLLVKKSSLALKTAQKFPFLLHWTINVRFKLSFPVDSFFSLNLIPCSWLLLPFFCFKLLVF